MRVWRKTLQIYERNYWPPVLNVRRNVRYDSWDGTADYATTVYRYDKS